MPFRNQEGKYEEKLMFSIGTRLLLLSESAHAETRLLVL